MATTQELFNVDAERGLINAILTEPGLLDTPAVQQIELTDFWLHTHQRAWLVIKQHYRKGREIDHITVADRLRRMDVEGAERDAKRIMGLLTDVALTHKGNEYARIVKDWARQRGAELAMSILGGSFGKDGNFEDGLDEALERLTEIKLGAGGPLPWEPRTLADAYEADDPTQFVIDGLFELPSLNVVYGAPSTFKTVLLTEAAICVAAGLPWLEPLPGELANTTRETSLVPTLWLDFDNGAKRMDKRVAAIGRARDLDAETLPFSYVCLPTPWLDASDNSTMQALARYIQRGSYGLVVVDNLGTVSGGADENSAAEMAPIFSNFRQVVERTGAALVIIHHRRKAQAGRAGDALRGSTSIEAALDLALQVTREPGSDLATLQSTKVRGADVYPFGALWTYDHKPDTTDLLRARFYGMPVDDTTSDHAIRETVLEIVEAQPGITRGDLVSTTGEGLGVGRNRIRRNIKQLVNEGKLVTQTGSHNSIEHYRA